MPDITIHVTMTNQDGGGLAGFHASLHDWQSGALLAEGEVPDDGTAALELSTPGQNTTGRLVVTGPAAQDHPSTANYEHSLPVHLEEDNKLRLVFSPCAEGSMDAWSPEDVPVAPAGESESEEAEPVPGEGDRVSGEVHVDCRYVTVNVKDEVDPACAYSAQITMHGTGFPLTRAKALTPVEGEDGKVRASFSVRQSAVRAYLTVWPDDDPLAVQTIPLKNLIAGAALELVYDE